MRMFPDSEPSIAYEHESNMMKSVYNSTNMLFDMYQRQEKVLLEITEKEVEDQGFVGLQKETSLRESGAVQNH